jgi:phosphomannomutase
MTIEETIGAARRWIAADPDPDTRRELASYIDDPSRHGLLVEVMSGHLQFGTAGLRAVVGPGPMRMNRAVVRRTTAGVARYLKQQSRGAAVVAPIVVGRDARASSAAFQQEVIGVLAAHGLRVSFFEAPVPTPIAAYVARRLGACACIVLTASHNPAEYNGYKLYGADAVQIVPPVDAEIAAEIARSAPANEEPMDEAAWRGGRPGIEPIREDRVDAYYRDVAALRPAGAPARDLVIAYTPLHGVGAPAMERVLAEAEFRNVHVVAAQRDPDGSFPTVVFPNPEEAGALDLVTELARKVHADLVIANDPDVDRLAASAPDASGRWVAFTGNQIGVLLADFVLQQAATLPRPLVVQSVVSSPMLRTIAEAYGARFELTLTGFKWIWTAALELMAREPVVFVFGYEEALGYSPGQAVRDKDGISAGLLLAELAALEKARQSSLRERLAVLYRRHGLWVSVQRSVTRPGLSGAAEIRAAMARLTSAPPTRIHGASVSGVSDFRTGGERRPRWLENTSLVELTLGDRGRVLVRPSGTEPKLKIYVDLACPVAASADVWSLEAGLLGEARALAEDLVAQLGLSRA